MGDNLSFDLLFQMKEEELLLTHQVGDVINILQRTTHHLFDPDELLTVRQIIICSSTFLLFCNFSCLFPHFLWRNELMSNRPSSGHKLGWRSFQFVLSDISKNWLMRSINIIWKSIIYIVFLLERNKNTTWSENFSDFGYKRLNMRFSFHVATTCLPWPYSCLLGLVVLGVWTWCMYLNHSSTTNYEM